jgi:hypothetical protein
MLCPNCDGVINALGCQGCGWKHGQASTRHEAVNPYRAGAEYPDHVNEPAPFANRAAVKDIPVEKIQARVPVEPAVADTAPSTPAPKPKPAKPANTTKPN